ncbi:YveK family protein [Siminovitchia terrae]|uniref:YveK family protein n=1 Tax=Siminovitchia terrae TaxID=1914933 RepID=UPI0028A6EE55|nr:Wzz/FepE/Etk N-terminal domain-containing protein [Siminovitchia terrae]
MNQFDHTTGKEMNLRYFLKVIKKRLWLIALITVSVTAAGWLFTTFDHTSPKYQASTNIIIDADTEYRNTLQVVIKDTTVLEAVVNELDLAQSAEALAKQVYVESIDDTQVVKISVVDSDPTLAASIANTTAKVFKRKVPSIVDINGVRVLSKAKTNVTPMKTNETKILLASFILGIVSGLGLVFIMDYFDDSIKSERDIEKLLGMQVLGTVSKKKKTNKKIRKRRRRRELKFRGETIGID